MLYARGVVPFSHQQAIQLCIYCGALDEGCSLIDQTLALRDLSAKTLRKLGAMLHKMTPVMFFPIHVFHAIMASSYFILHIYTSPHPSVCSFLLCMDTTNIYKQSEGFVYNGY